MGALVHLLLSFFIFLFFFLFVLLCCVWGSGRAVCGVYCLLSTLYVLWCVFQCGVCCLVVLWVVEWRWGVRGVVACFPLPLFLSSSLPLLLLPLFVLVFGVVRAQLCEHARYPRTPLRLSCCVLSSLLLSVPLRSPPFYCLEWRWVIHHVSVCCVGMTATGSLSRSSSFF